jgi:glucose 1-dehydrogenase
MTEALKEPARLLAGQRALVTGANSGIGMAVAKALAAAGASVVVNYVSNENVARQVVNDIEEGGGTAMAFQADVSEEDQVKVMFKEMIEAFGSIDILVNKSAWETPEAEHELLQLIPYDRIGETSDIA